MKNLRVLTLQQLLRRLYVQTEEGFKLQLLIIWVKILPKCLESSI